MATGSVVYLGVGGSEFVYSKKIEKLTVGDLAVEGFEIQIGATRYSFRLSPLHGVVGMDFLRTTESVIYLAEFELRSS